MPLIEYTQPKIHILRGSRVNSRQIEFEFRPGAENEVPQDVWDNLKEHSGGCKALLKRGLLKEVYIKREASTNSKPVEHVSDNVSLSDKFPAKKQDGRLVKMAAEEEKSGEPEMVQTMKEVDISNMTAWDATEFIEKVYTEETLVRFTKQENSRKVPRKTVVKALENQLSVMRTDMTQSSKLI